jgi:hypothetical protein
MDFISVEFSMDRNHDEQAFMLWRGNQMAIGELLTVKEDNELYCMGFAAFTEKYHTDQQFKKWFKPIESVIVLVAEAGGNGHGNPAATYRLRRLQHLPVDLILHLNKHGSGSSSKQLKTDAAPHCICDGCPGTAAVLQIVSPTTKLPEP